MLYIKQDDRVAHKCLELEPAIRPFITCKEVPNVSGREAHTIAEFVYEYYDRLPRITFFAQARPASATHITQVLWWTTGNERD